MRSSGLLKDKDAPEMTSFKRVLPWVIAWLWILLIIHSRLTGVELNASTIESLKWLMGFGIGPITIQQLAAAFK